MLGCHVLILPSHEVLYVHFCGGLRLAHILVHGACAELSCFAFSMTAQSVWLLVGRIYSTMLNSGGLSASLMNLSS